MGDSSIRGTFLSARMNLKKIMITSSFSVVYLFILFVLKCLFCQNFFILFLFHNQTLPWKIRTNIYAFSNE